MQTDPVQTGWLVGQTHTPRLLRMRPPVHCGGGRWMQALPVQTGLRDGQTHAPALLRKRPPVHGGGGGGGG